MRLRPGFLPDKSRGAPAALGTTYLRNEDHSLESGSLDLSYSATLRSNHVFRAGVAASEEDLRERFELSDDAWAPEGRYRGLEGRIGYTMPIRYPLRPNVDACWTGRGFRSRSLRSGRRPRGSRSPERT